MCGSIVASAQASVTNASMASAPVSKKKSSNAPIATPTINDSQRNKPAAAARQSAVGELSSDPHERTPVMKVTPG